ncbi:uncharacterized protein C7orf57 homolog [Thunnus albacares]|uniref:uncharacterized protein C7orf57 homolog n=1 Tax=Thunnus maccoyii TaxID=8240 RepID=UPI001C4AC9AA|nr:uncharacterized protein C7orf57 homolog [Thunnus maccoyii]XP_044221100.1 uncharacterized protein C7orf57 homolog [Thunnus albacares]
MYSEPSPVLMSNDLQPTKSGMKTGYHGINGQISQIPGLSPTVSSVCEERARGRRGGVLDSDSDYIKLAKQGGHKGLLWHEESFTSQPISYKPPNWFCTSSEDNSGPSLITIEKKKSPGAFQHMEPPFGTDNMSAWERDDSSNGEEKNNNVHNNQMENLQSPSHHETSKFKRIVFDKKPAPVDMSKLLSFGYADDNKPTVDTFVSN